MVRDEGRYKVLRYEENERESKRGYESREKGEEMERR